MPLLRERQHTAPAYGERPIRSRAKRVLLVIDSTSAVETIAEWIAASPEDLVGAEVILLAALPEPDLTRTRALFAETVRRELRGTGASRLVSLQAMLDDAGIASEDVIVLDDAAASIVATAEQKGCDRIVMTAAPESPLRKQFLSLTGIGASSAARVAGLAECPVLIIKHGWR